MPIISNPNRIYFTFISVQHFPVLKREAIFYFLPVFSFYTLLGFHFLMSSCGKTIDIEIQKAIVSEYSRGKKGCGRRNLAKKYGVSPTSVKNIVSRAKRNHGEPYARRGHKKRKLSEKEEKRICTHLDKHPDATNEQLVKTVGEKISPRTVSDVLARASPPFSKKKFSDQEPEEFSDEWKDEARTFIQQVKRIAQGRRVYGDESALFSNDAPKMGRARRGKRLLRKRKRHGKKYTLHAFVKQNSVVHWTLRDKNANDVEVKKVMGYVTKKFQRGDVLIWDRLGRSGRCKNPKKQHFNPGVVNDVEDRGAEVIYLPPKGKYFNPVELLFNDLKAHYVRPAYGKSNKEMSKDKLTRIVRKYMREVAPTKLPGFFRARANGAEAIRLGLI